MVALKSWQASIPGKEQQQLLQRRILFTPAQRPVSSKMQLLQLEPLNELLPSDFAMRGSEEASRQDCVEQGSVRKMQHLPEDHREEEAWLVWEGPMRIGAGLQNLGNTCFLNSVLQCMTYTPPLAKFLRSGQHKVSCHVAGFCAVCALEAHVKQALSSTDKVISPQTLVKNLRCISRAFQPWRQEDAHEYMRYLVEALHKCLSNGITKSSYSDLNQSLVHRIFGGRLRSQVKCTNCYYCSDTFDPFLDLSLEIVNADSLPRALAHFTRKEIIDGDNKYHCEKCKQKVRATKCFTIDAAPNILTIQFKRFSNTGHFGGKINKKVDFGPTLDITPFLSKGQEVCKYKLYAVLVHSGGSTHSGHYYCFVRTSTDIWHILDDSRVKQVSEKTVLEQKAYMLFYVRNPTRKSMAKPPSTAAAFPSKSAPKDTLQVSQSAKIHVDQKLGSLAVKPDVGKRSTDSENLVNVQSVQCKEMQLATELTGAQASSTAEPKVDPRGVLKNNIGENGLNIGDMLQKKEATFHISSIVGKQLNSGAYILKDMQTHVKQTAYTGYAQAEKSGDLTNGSKQDILKISNPIGEENSLSSRTYRAAREPRLSPPGAGSLASQQQEKLMSTKTITAQECSEDERVEVARKDSRATESPIEHDGGKVCKRGSAKKKSTESRLYHLKLLQVMPRARNFFLSKALSIIKRRSTGADSGCHKVLHANGTAAGTTVNSTARNRKPKKRKLAGAELLSTSQKRLHVEDQERLEKHYAKLGADSAEEPNKQSSLDSFSTGAEAVRGTMSERHENAQLTGIVCLEEPKKVSMKLLKRTEATKLLSVADNVCNGYKPMVDLTNVYENPSLGKSNLNVPETTNGCARDDALGESVRISRTPKNELYGSEVPRWNEADGSKQSCWEIGNLLKKEHSIPRKAIDTWDEAYDRGKIKKVRKRVAPGSGFRQLENGNPFQTLVRAK
ncbi:hypothetical protein O6H91_13G070200 [Diphasiastrum complanatum]|uniref:Uncharacterized protein n=1 Tax=Diphasiastrum complanatum TaxID=34168 RepID=A0ACC2BVU1_DIPCM|nr:hypothetical protein O6H91_13G070200 [Diphasiastrum complanatum]